MTLQLKREACLIDGAWVTSSAWLDVENPATGELIGRVPSLGYQETEQAIAAAQTAMLNWSARTAKQRAAILQEFQRLIRAHRAELAALITEEQGKPLKEAMGEVEYAASFIEWFAEEAKRVYGDVIQADTPGKRLIVLKQPIGVVAAITPWNFPAAMVTRKIGPALAAGCAVVLKPAPQTPFTALALGVLAEQAGVPPGVLNILTGPAEVIGRALVESPIVRKLSFTGSTAVGAKLFAQCADTIKRLSLELGGNAPFIVFDDADLDAAVDGAILAKFRNAGQTCVCANRFYVQAGIYDAFLARFIERVRALRTGDGNLADSDIGPLIDRAAMAKVQTLMSEAVGSGAIVETGGEVCDVAGRFLQPTVLSNVTGVMRISQEEIFGPVASVTRFEDEADVVTLANATPFGLCAYFYSRDVARVWRVAEALEVGIVGVNTGLISTEVAPFGGVKMSGLGREGSKYGIDDYLELKYLCWEMG
jgi:succinate-semialdehyde dehydrogenase / glutarate-semialdehyde dehydrogenase